MNYLIVFLNDINFTIKMKKLQENFTIESALKIAVVFLIIYSSYIIFKPFMVVVMWAVIMSVSLMPLQRKLTKVFRGRKTLSVLIITFTLLGLIIIPTSLFTDSVVGSIQGLAGELEAGTYELKNPDESVKEIPVVGDKLYNLWTSVTSNLTAFFSEYQEQLQGVGTWILSSVKGLFGAIFTFVFAIIISAFFLLKGDKLSVNIKKLYIKLAGNKGEAMFDTTSDIIISVMKGIIGVAFIQTFLIAIGFFFWGVPGASVLSLIILLLAIAQLPPLVIVVPVMIYMSGELSGASLVFFIIWSSIAMLSDKFLQPIMLSKSKSTPFLVIMIGAIGGMMVMGLIGLFIGAVILALFYHMVGIWLKDEEDEISVETLEEI